MVVKDGGRVIGGAGVQFLTDNQAKLERMAVLSGYRYESIGMDQPLHKSSNYKNLEPISFSPSM
jgi:hypothetical protein